jgi:hypothetical protein
MTTPIKFRCDICSSSFKDNNALLRHCSSTIHVKKKIEFEKKILEELKKKREEELLAQGIVEEDDEIYDEVDFDVEISDPRLWTNEFMEEYIKITPRYINFRNEYEVKRLKYHNRLLEIDEELSKGGAVSKYKPNSDDSDQDDASEDVYMSRMTKNWFSDSKLGYQKTKELLVEREEVMSLRNAILYQVKDKMPIWKEICRKEIEATYFLQQKKKERRLRLLATLN